MPHPKQLVHGILTLGGKSSPAILHRQGRGGLPNAHEIQELPYTSKHGRRQKNSQQLVYGKRTQRVKQGDGTGAGKKLCII